MVTSTGRRRLDDSRFWFLHIDGERELRRIRIICAETEKGPETAMDTIDLEEVVYGMCCWCGRRLERDAPVVDFGATLASHDTNLEKLLGCSVEIESGETVVTAVVCETGSDAHEAGDDVLFIACSDDCGNSTCDFLEGLDAIRLAPLSEETVRRKLKA